MIKYIRGDATSPVGTGNKIIVHVCNDIGAWGSGFVAALSKKWKAPEKNYREWFTNSHNFDLGEVQFVQVTSNIWVANMIAQKGVRIDFSGNPPVRYSAIKKGLSQVSKYAKQINATVHMPRIGCGLGGGSWNQVETLIKEEICDVDIQSFVYDFD